MAQPIKKLTPEDTAGWPATPGQQRMEQALIALANLEAAGSMCEQAVRIPAHVPEAERPYDYMQLTGPRGEETHFNAYHQRRITIPDEFSMKEWKVRNAQAMHDCMQARTFSKACSELFHRTLPRGPEETWWFVQTAAQLGDSAHTIGIAIQRPSPDTPDKDITVITKVPRNEHWMGYCMDLQNLEGLSMMIYPALDMPELPSFAIACPSDREFDGPVGTNVKPDPKREAGMLALIALHHGADRCLWYPADAPE